MAKIRVKKAPSGLPNQIVPGGFNSNGLQKPAFETGRTLKAVPRNEANIEAEAGETALMPDKGGLPAHFNIGGNRHTSGGTPLNVPKDTFIFSDTKKMRIKDPEILAEFGKSKGSYTPADLAKKYNINKFRKLVQDPDSDKLQVETAEKMIENYNLKLAKLALVQESKKGFPQGIPAVAMPYLATYNVEPDQILPLQEKQPQIPQMRFGGSLPKAQYGNNPDLTALRKIYEENQKAQAYRKIKQIDENAIKYAKREAEEKRLAAHYQGKDRYTNAKAIQLQDKMKKLYSMMEVKARNQYDPNWHTVSTNYNDLENQYADTAGEYLKLFPQADTFVKGPGTPGLYNFPKTKKEANSFVESIPATGIPGFSPTNRVMITKAPGTVAPATKTSATPKAPKKDTTKKAAEIFNF